MLSQQFSIYGLSEEKKDLDKDIEEIEKSKNPENKNLTEFPNFISNLETTHGNASKVRTDLFFENNQANNYEDIPVGSFLDSFKSDPLLQSIYFTSKDIIFSYKKKIANALQLGFDMQANDYEYFNKSLRAEKEAMERRMSSVNGQNVQREAGLLFGFIIDSYKTILYSILAIFAVVYVSFRYFLNKYI